MPGVMKVGSRGVWRPVDLVEMIGVQGAERGKRVLVSVAGEGLRTIIGDTLPITVSGSERSVQSKRRSDNGFDAWKYTVYPGEKLTLTLSGANFETEKTGKKPRSLYLWNKS